MNLHSILSQEGKFTFAGNTLHNTLGYSYAELSQNTVQYYLQASVAAQVTNFLQHAQVADSLTLAEVQFRCKDSKWLWVELMLTGHPDGSILMSLRHLGDIISTHNIKHKITSSYASLFALHPSGIAKIDANAQVSMINPQMHEDLGYDLDALQRQSLLHLVVPQYRYKVMKKFLCASKNGQSATFDIQVYHAYGHPVHVNFTIIPVVHQTEVLELYMVVKDISDRIQLQESLKKLSIVADKTTNGVAILNGDFNIEWVNDGFCQISGYSVQEAVGARVGALLKMEDDGKPIAEEGRRMIKGGRSVEHELICYRKDGSSFWNLIKLTPILNEQGIMERCITIHDDITDKKKAELDLRMLADDLYRQNKELHQFAYIVSHNLRSPVANILGLVSVLEAFKDDEETLGQSLVALSRAVHNLDAVIKDLSYILTINDGNKQVFKEPVNLQDLLRQVLDDMQTLINNTNTQVELPSKPLVMLTNKAYVYSIFYNLISNAIKYRSQHNPVIKVDFYSTPDHNVIYVEDNGKGIDLQKHANDLFKPYKRFDFKAEGKGLGLFLVKSHIEAMGGELSVQSELQKGSTFYIKVPLA